MRNRLKISDGSIQGIGEIPEEIRAVYRTAWEIPMRSLIDMAAERGAFIDQSQSLNLFVQSPNIGKTVVDVHVCVEEGAEDDVLLEVAAGDGDCEDDGFGSLSTATSAATRESGGRLLAGKSQVRAKRASR